MSILINAVVMKNGLVKVHATNASGTANSVITSISGTPTYFVDGVKVTSGLYGPIWCDSTHDHPAVYWQITPALTPSSVVTYTIPANCINTALGGNLVVTSQAPVINSMGSLEPTFGEASSKWGPPTKCKAGVNLDNGAWVPTQTQPHAANHFLRSFWLPSGGVTITLATDQSQIQSWSPTSGTLSMPFANYNGANGIDALGYPSMQGAYVFSWIDANIGTSGELKVILKGTSATTALTTQAMDGKPETGTTLSGGVRTVLPGNRVVITYANVNYASFPNTANGYNMDPTWVVSSTSGLWASGNTISGVIAVGPNDSIAQVLADPYAPSNNLLSVLKAPNGAVPATIRAMNTVFGNLYGNPIDVGDAAVQVLTQNSYSKSSGPQSRSLTITSVRRYSTDPNNPIVSWNSTKIYDWTLPGDGSDSVGPYIDLTVRNGSQGGESDNGQHLNPFPSQGKTSAVEVTFSAPHLLRTGDRFMFPGEVVATGGMCWPITGGATTALPNCAVTNGSQSITFATAITLANGITQGFTFQDDATGQAYRIGNASGSPITSTTWTMVPAYQGTSNAASPCAMTAFAFVANSQPDIVVTASDKVAFCAADCFFGVGLPSSGPIQKLSGSLGLAVTTPITVSIAVSTDRFGGNAPIGFYVNLCKKLGVMELQVPFQPNMSDALIVSIIDELATVNPPPGFKLCAELCDEVWNNSFPAFPAIQRIGNRAAFANGTLPNAPGTQRALSLYETYVILMSHKWAVAQARMDTYGQGWKIVRCIAGQYSFSTFASQTVTICNAQQIAFDRFMVAPYITCPPGGASNPTWVAAISTTGTNPGSLPVPQISDIARDYVKYSPTWWSSYSGNYNALQNYNVSIGGVQQPIPIVTCYESAFQNFLPTGDAAVCFDGWYDRTFIDLYNAFAQSVEDGDPRIPGSGPLIANHYTSGSMRSNAVEGEFQLWSLQVYAGQQPGDGTTNLFTSSQSTSGGNGINNDVSNNSPALAAWMAWMASANGLPSTGGGGFPAPPDPDTGAYAAFFRRTARRLDEQRSHVVRGFRFGRRAG